MRIYPLLFLGNFLFILSSPVHGTSQPDSWTEQSIHQAETLSLNLLETLHTIYDYQAYWIQQLNPSWRAYINRSPSNWTAEQPYAVKVQNTLRSLKQLADWYATGLGLLDITLKKIKSSIKPLETIDQYNQLVVIVNHFSSHNLDVTEPNMNDIHSEQSIKQILIANEFHLKQYKKHEIKHLDVYKPSCHISRNWLSYSLIAATVAGLLYYEYKNPGAFKNAYNYLCDGFKKYIHDPVANSLHNLFSPHNQTEIAQKRAKKQQAQRALIEKKQDQHDLIVYTFEEDYREENATLWSSFNGPIPPEEQQNIQTIATDAVFKGNRKELYNRLIEKMKHPIKNAILGNLIRHLFIGLMDADCTASELMLTADDIVESNGFNFFLFTMIPVGFFAWTAHYAYGQVSKHYKNKHIYIPLRNAICMLHHILNMPTHSPTDHGHFVYWVEQLKEYSKYFSSSEYQLLMIDISHLEAQHLNNAQKLNIIQRMFYTYGFLKAAPVLLETRHVTDLLSIPIEAAVLV